MSNLKPKEPLLALLLTFVYFGLGQVYSGRLKRGLAVIGINLASLLAILPILLYIINPNTRFNTALFISCVVLAIIGVIWGVFILVDAYRCAKTFNKNNNLERNITAGKRTLLILGIIIVLFMPSIDTPIKMYVKNNIVQAYRFPSASMEPIIQKGDRLFADKVIYKKSKPQRGDLIVFKYPDDPKKEFVKRLIAFGGETVEIIEGRVYINGQPCIDAKIKDRYYYNSGDYGQANKPVVVPEGAYYVLGDNSASSMDSRYRGFVLSKDVSGKIYKIYLPMNRSGKVE